MSAGRHGARRTPPRPPLLARTTASSDLYSFLEGQYTQAVYGSIKEGNYIEAVRILEFERQNFPRSRAALSVRAARIGTRTEKRRAGARRAVCVRACVRRSGARGAAKPDVSAGGPTRIRGCEGAGRVWCYANWIYASFL